MSYKDSLTSHYIISVVLNLYNRPIDYLYEWWKGGKRNQRIIRQSSTLDHFVVCGNLMCLNIIATSHQSRRVI